MLRRPCSACCQHAAPACRAHVPSAASSRATQLVLPHRQRRRHGFMHLRFDPLRLARCSSTASAADGLDAGQPGGSGSGRSSGDGSGNSQPPAQQPSAAARTQEQIESEALPESFCIIESRDSVKNFAKMQLSEIEDNIVSRRNRIFLLMEEVRRLRIQRRLKTDVESSDWVPEEKFDSAIPWLPPITEDTIADYWRFYLVTVALIILFGGLLAPILEVKLGVGGQSYRDFIGTMHLPGQLAAVDPIVASFCGGAVGVLSTLMVVEANNASQQAKRRCFYCQGSGYLTCGACVGSGAGEEGGGCNLCSGTGKVMCTACLCTGRHFVTEHDVRIDPFD